MTDWLNLSNPVHHATSVEPVVKEEIVMWHITLRNGFDDFLC